MVLPLKGKSGVGRETTPVPMSIFAAVCVSDLRLGKFTVATPAFLTSLCRECNRACFS